MKKYAFIDRDGCIVEEPEDYQVDALAKIKLMPGVIPALLKMRESGFRLVMVSNQDGLGTSSFPRADFELAQNFILHLLSSQGIEFDEVLICPHFAADDCGCRKPAVGMVRDFLGSDDWSRESSVMIGDRGTDMQLAANMGVLGLQVGKDLQGQTHLTWAEIAHRLVQRPRTAKVQRQTSETSITAEVDLDGSGSSDIATGIGFLDHMLTSFSKHSGIDLRLSCAGDLHVDDHHSVEDVALVLGEVIAKALGDKRGCGRFGFMLPMDETEASASLDLSGRAYLVFSASFSRQMVGELATEMVPHFFRSLCDALGANLHVKVVGENDHHRIEAAFKVVARCLGQAIKRDPGKSHQIPSTKGSL